MHGDLPAGEYAVTAYHDKNNNEKFDRTLFGRPRESFGYTTNSEIGTGRVQFDNTRFTYDGGNQSVRIVMN